MGRRSANEGSIHRRKKDGLWCAQYTVDTADGGTKRGYVYGKKRDVAEKLAQAVKDRADGLLDAGDLSVAGSFAERMGSEKEPVREFTRLPTPDARPLSGSMCART